MAREMPVKAYVKSKLEEEKEKKVVEDLVAQNHIEVPEDFTVPEVSDEAIQEMMNKQNRLPQNLPEGTGTDAPPAATDKKGDKKAEAPKKK
jgi:ribosomal protein L12E/L44/L45/RPP1/RPP2